MRLTQRDRSILSDVGLAVVLGMKSIHERRFPEDQTGKSCIRRLGKLTQAGLLHAMPNPLSVGESGRLSNVYYLTKDGAEFVSSQLGLTPSHVLTKPPRPLFLAHRLNLAAVVLRLQDDARSVCPFPPRWLFESKRSAKASKGSRVTEQRVLYEEFATSCGYTVSMRPDGSTHLQVPAHNTGELRDLILYHEIDNDLEDPAMIRRKFPGYYENARQQGFIRHWDDLPRDRRPRTMILFTCVSSDRVDRLVRLIRSSPACVYPGTASVGDKAKEHALTFLTDHVFLSSHEEQRGVSFLTDPIWHTINPDRPRRAIVPRKA